MAISAGNLMLMSPAKSLLCSRPPCLGMQHPGLVWLGMRAVRLSEIISVCLPPAKLVHQRGAHIGLADPLQEDTIKPDYRPGKDGAMESKKNHYSRLPVNFSSNLKTLCKKNRLYLTTGQSRMERRKFVTVGSLSTAQYDMCRCVRGVCFLRSLEKMKFSSQASSNHVKFPVKLANSGLQSSVSPSDFNHRPVMTVLLQTLKRIESTVDKESLHKQLCPSGSMENTRDLLHRWIEEVKSLAAIRGSSKRKREDSPASVSKGGASINFSPSRFGKEFWRRQKRGMSHY
ncbi:hypothetical protein J6590_095909 [Homalodisca vitripennis]|nr:hypothetical protein J6590_095909 [Homalodisca vitripennis]